MNQSERKKILRTLKKIKKYLKDNPAEAHNTRVAFIDIYIDEYSKNQVNIGQDSFSSYYPPNSEGKTPENNASKYKNGGA